MGRYLRNCKKLHRAAGALVLLVHHSGKDESKGARGWSGIRAAADAEIEISSMGITRTAQITKQKDGDDSAAFDFKLNKVFLGTDEDGEEISSCVVDFLPHGSAASNRSRTPKGKLEKTVYKAVKELIDLDGPAVEVEEVINHVSAGMPHDPKSGRDRRREVIRRAITSLGTSGFVEILHNQISLPIQFVADTT